MTSDPPVPVRTEVVSDDGVTRVEKVIDTTTGHQIGTNVMALVPPEGAYVMAAMQAAEPAPWR